MALLAKFSDLEIEPEQRAAAREVLRIEPKAFGKASKVLLCWTEGEKPWHFGFRFWPCGYSLLCPACARRRARGLAGSAMARAAEYRTPKEALITCPSRGAWDLEETFAAYNAGLSMLKRKREFAGSVRAGVAVVEPTRERAGERWSFHAHAVLDVVPERFAAFSEWVGRAWPAIVDRPGAQFLLGDVRYGTDAVIRYALKVADEKAWCSLGEVWDEGHVEARRRVVRAFHRRRLVRAWG